MMTVGTTVEADTSGGMEGSVLGGSPGGMAVMAADDYLEVRYFHNLLNPNCMGSFYDWPNRPQIDENALSIFSNDLRIFM